MRIFLRIVMMLCLVYSPLSIAANFELDMRDVEIREFIDTIAQLTGKTIVVDQRVQGRVDIRSHRKLSEKELYEVFLVQLGVNGYAVVDLGDGLTKVIPAQAAKAEGVEVSYSGQAQSSERIITRVVQVTNVDATKLIPVLQPLIDSQTGTVAPFAESNILLITDRESNVKRLLDIIQRVDRSDSLSLDVIALKNASAQEMERILNSILKQLSIGKEGGAAPSITADVRTNSLLVVADTNVRAYLSRVIKQLDADITTSSNTKVVYLKYANADDLLPVLRSVSVSLSRTTTGQIQQSNSSINISIEAHQQTNAVILSGSPGMIKDLEAIIAKLDIRRAQVLVEAIIVELSENLSRSLGVQWLASDTGAGSSPSAAVNFNNNSAGIIDLTGAALSGSNSVADTLSGQQGLLFGVGKIVAGNISFAALLNAVASDTDSNILSTPSILTMDNEEANILVGQEVPVITGSVAGDNNSNPFQTISRQDIGIKLKVTPQINDGDAIQLAIEQEVSSLSGATSADIIINKRQINTRVLADDGAIVVLGGLIDDDVQESSSKVPVLGDVPLLGYAFKSDSTKRVRRNLMVFIRPVILRDKQSMEQLSHNKYRQIRAQQLLSNEEGINLFPGDKGPQLPEPELSAPLSVIPETKAKPDTSRVEMLNGYSR